MLIASPEAAACLVSWPEELKVSFSPWALAGPAECQVSVHPPPEAVARAALIPPGVLKPPEPLGVKVPVAPSGSK